MVRRLVQQQQVRLGHRGPGDQHQAPPAAAEGFQRLCRLRLVEAEGREDRLGAIGEDLALRRRHAVRHGRKRGRGFERGRQHLLDIADGKIAPGQPPAFVDLLAAGKHAQQGRLAAAIGPDEPDPVALPDGEIEAGEHTARAIGEAQIFDAEKGHGSSTVKGEGYRAPACRAPAPRLWPTLTPAPGSGGALPP